ncbi:MAG: DNA-processing protein DprA [Bacteroidota bacterium]
MDEERLYQVALTKIPGLGDTLIKNLIAYSGSASQVFKLNKGKLLKCPGIGQKVASEVLDPSYIKISEEELIKCDKHHVRTLFYTDEDFPENLRHAQDSPSLLYIKGKGTFEHTKRVAIVGTRKATSYGKEITEEIVKGLQSYHPVIISGLAFGIDIEAHRAALSQKLENISVLAHGLDIIYPSQHRSVAENITENGLIVSEYGVGVKPETYHFPARNRIIAGLTDLVIVVEAAEKGGALITAEIASSYDREVFAVPGSLKMKYSRGCNRLIKQQIAHIYSGIPDLLKVMNWDTRSAVKNKVVKPVLEPQEEIVYDVLNMNSNGVALDDLSWKSQIGLNKLASILLSMEFKGIVRSLPGKKYKIIA